MSELNEKPERYPSWKQEVNKRVAAHLHRKTPRANEATATKESHAAPVGRAAQAAARVAARYANAPSYNEMLAEEARAAVRAAQAASRAAQEAHAAAQSILDGLEAASEEASWELETAREGVHANGGMAEGAPSQQASPEHLPFDESLLFSSNGAEEVSARPEDLPPVVGSPRESRPTIYEARTDDRQLPSAAMLAAQGGREIFAGEAAQPIYANLIQFPREMVATRKLRPRRIEGPLAGTERGSQLSIFEVDPGAISNQPTQPAADETAAPTWMRPEWPVFELERQLPQDLQEEPARQARRTLRVDLAPLSRRLLAIVVDASLVSAAFAFVAMKAAAHANRLHNPRAALVVGVLTLMAIGAGYLTLFFTLIKLTPGMWYAGIALSTLEGDCPTRAQRYRRLMALPLSVLPLGLGLAWALFDDCNLTWHDRLSGTFLRKR